MQSAVPRYACPDQGAVPRLKVLAMALLLPGGHLGGLGGSAGGLGGPGEDLWALATPPEC